MLEVSFIANAILVVYTNSICVVFCKDTGKYDDRWKVVIISTKKEREENERVNENTRVGRDDGIDRTIRNTTA